MTLQRSSLKLLTPFLLLAALGFGLSAWIYAKRIEHTLMRAEISRLQFTLDDLKADIEQGLAAGQSLRELANAQPALEAEARLDPDIALIAARDRNGRIVYQSGTDQAGNATPTAVAELLGPDGEEAGTLAVWLGTRSRDAVAARARIGLALAALCAALATVTATMAAMAWLVRRKDEVLEAIADGLEPTGKATDPRIARLVDEVNQQAATTLVNIAATRHLLQQRRPDA
jgi:hypothetical protein